MSPRSKTSELALPRAYHIYRLLCLLSVAALLPKFLTPPFRRLPQDPSPDAPLILVDFGVAGVYGHLNAAEPQVAGMSTLAGTPFYLAPEFLNPMSKKYSNKVDIWSIGIITYQMCFGTTPFQDSLSFKELYDRIFRAEFQMPDDARVSELARIFIRALLEPVPERRLDAKAVLGHSWIRERCPELVLTQLRELNAKADPGMYGTSEDLTLRQEVDVPPTLPSRPIGASIVQQDEEPSHLLAPMIPDPTFVSTPVPQTNAVDESQSNALESPETPLLHQPPVVTDIWNLIESRHHRSPSTASAGSQFSDHHAKLGSPSPVASLLLSPPIAVVLSPPLQDQAVFSSVNSSNHKSGFLSQPMLSRRASFSSGSTSNSIDRHASSSTSPTRNRLRRASFGDLGTALPNTQSIEQAEQERASGIPVQELIGLMASQGALLRDRTGSATSAGPKLPKF